VLPPIAARDDLDGTPPAATKSASNCRRAQADNAYRAGCAREATPPAAQIQPTTSPSTGHSPKMRRLPCPDIFERRHRAVDVPACAQGFGEMRPRRQAGAASTRPAVPHPATPTWSGERRSRAFEPAAVQLRVEPLSHCLAAGSIQSPKTWMA